MKEYIDKIKAIVSEIKTELLDAWESEEVAGTFDDEWYYDKKTKELLSQKLQDIIDDYEYVQGEINNH